MIEKNTKTKRAFFIRLPSIFSPQIILFFRFWNNVISRSPYIFDEQFDKKSQKMRGTLAGWAGWAGWAGLAGSEHSLEL